VKRNARLFNNDTFFCTLQSDEWIKSNANRKIDTSHRRDPDNAIQPLFAIYTSETEYNIRQYMRWSDIIKLRRHVEGILYVNKEWVKTRKSHAKVIRSTYIPYICQQVCDIHSSLQAYVSFRRYAIATKYISNMAAINIVDRMTPLSPCVYNKNYN